MGYTSSGNSDDHTGLRYWESPPSAAIDAPQLQQFSKLPSPGSFPFSALFQVLEVGQDVLSLHGSPVLINHAQEHTDDESNVKTFVRACLRAPQLVVRGQSAEKVTKSSICGYSDYVAALFDNFE
jgi:hypothetical protein